MRIDEKIRDGKLLQRGEIKKKYTYKSVNVL